MSMFPYYAVIIITLARYHVYSIALCTFSFVVVFYVFKNGDIRLHAYDLIMHVNNLMSVWCNKSFSFYEKINIYCQNCRFTEQKLHHHATKNLNQRKLGTELDAQLNGASFSFPPLLRKSSGSIIEDNNMD